MKKVTAISMSRWRASASECRFLGLKVGSTKTQFLVKDDEREGYYSAVAATPGERRTIAIGMFLAKLPSERPI